MFKSNMHILIGLCMYYNVVSTVAGLGADVPGFVDNLQQTIRGIKHNSKEQPSHYNVSVIRLLL